MKKSFLFLLFIVSAVTFAQDRQRFGVNAGLTYSNFRGMDIVTFEYKYAFGYMAGISYEYYLNDNLSLKANLSYDNKSSKATSYIEFRDGVEGTIEIDEQTITYNYNYLTLPILIKYDFEEGSNSFFINGGPFIGYLLNSEFISELDSSFESSNETFSTTENNNKLDFGLTVGFGKAFEISDGNSIVVEIRDNLGLAQTNKNGTYEGRSVQSNSINLVLGWAFDL